ncbi:hypothetical protein [Leptolyngbya sp. GGD]|uniref:hypothetical protein n=1 Tax=Leptolyngbya sp. GGD TaxID=2997907 RepID=UPI00227C7AA6|nr:hypothetical protein [Leptolyngbya sp. GGD]MCY6492134.1 hypothetical protein [Leptolyngbya sp. GGD]
MDAGFESAELADFAQKGIPDRALAIIVEYYALEASQCRTTASPQVGDKSLPNG